MSKKESSQKIIHFQLAGVNEIFSAPEWQLESQILATKHKLGIGIWTAHKIIKDYAPINTVSPTPADSSSISHSDEPAVVPKRVRKTKTKPQANELSPVSSVVDITNPLDLVPDMLRHKFTDGLSDPIPDSSGSGDNLQEIK